MEDLGEEESFWWRSWKVLAQSQLYSKDAAFVGRTTYKRMGNIESDNFNATRCSFFPDSEVYCLLEN